MSMKGNCLAGPDFTLFIDGEQYYWEHWGMVDDYSYRQDIAKKIRWYHKHGYYDYLIQTWGGGDRDLRGQVLAELSKFRKRKRRKFGYERVFKLRKHRLRKKGWVIFLAIVLALFLFVAFFSSKQVPTPITMSEVPKAVLQKREPEKEVLTEEPAMEKKEKTEMFYMGIDISR